MINQLTSMENNSTPGSAMESKELVDRMNILGRKCGFALIVYYNKLGKDLWAQSLENVLKILYAGRTVEIFEYVYEAAEKYKDEAAQYGYTDEELAEFKSCIEQYRVIAANDQSIIAAKKKMDEITQAWRMRQAA